VGEGGVRVEQAGATAECDSRAGERASMRSEQAGSSGRQGQSRRPEDRAGWMGTSGMRGGEQA
jgi:hypothetical protein